MWYTNAILKPLRNSLLRGSPRDLTCHLIFKIKLHMCSVWETAPRGDPPASGMAAVLGSAGSALPSLLSGCLFGWMRAGCFHCYSGASRLALVLRNRSEKLLLQREHPASPSSGESCSVLLRAGWGRVRGGCQLPGG